MHHTCGIATCFAGLSGVYLLCIANLQHGFNAWGLLQLLYALNVLHTAFLRALQLLCVCQDWQKYQVNLPEHSS
jgi:hypothetical protein